MLDHYLRYTPAFRQSDARRIHAALLRVCVCPHHAGDGRLWLSRLLRTQGPLPAERALRAAESALVAAERRTAGTPAFTDGRIRKDRGVRETAEPVEAEPKVLACGSSVFRFTAACRKTTPGMAADLFSTAAACPIPAARSVSKALPEETRRHRLLESARERASVSRQRHVAGGRQREQLSESRLQEPDGVLRLHRRTASFGVYGRAAGPAFARQSRCRGCRAPSRPGEFCANEGDGPCCRPWYAASPAH